MANHTLRKTAEGGIEIETIPAKVISTTTLEREEQKLQMLERQKQMYDKQLTAMTAKITAQKALIAEINKL